MYKNKSLLIAGTLFLIVLFIIYSIKYNNVENFVKKSRDCEVAEYTLQGYRNIKTFITKEITDKSNVTLKLEKKKNKNEDEKKKFGINTMYIGSLKDLNNYNDGFILKSIELEENECKIN